MRAFLDTNFLLDCVLPGRPEHAAAQTIKGLVDVGLIEGVCFGLLSQGRVLHSHQTGRRGARARGSARLP